MSIGGGSGGLLSGIGGILGGMFGGPIGALVGQLVGQIVQQVAGQVLQQIGQELGNVSQQGMQAGQDALNQQLGNGDASRAGGRNDLAGFVNDIIAQLGGGTPQQAADVHNAVDNLKTAIADLVKQMVQDSFTGADGKSSSGRGRGAAGGGGSTGEPGAAGGSGAAGGPDGASGSDGGGDDFFIALAKALGAALDKQAKKVSDLSKQLTAANEAAEGTKDNDRQDAQNKIASIQTELAAQSQKFSFLSQTVQTAMSALGNALNTLGRTQ